MMKALLIGAILVGAVDARADTIERSVDATVHFGFTRAPFEAPALPEAKGHGFVFLVEGSYEVAPDYLLSVRVPTVLVSIAQPAGSYTDRAVLGNPQLRVARRILERRPVALLAGLEVGVPVAGHDEDRLPNRALAIADGIEGRAAPELFTPGILPTTVGGELSFGTQPWSFGTSARLPFLLRISDADMPSSTTNGVGLAAVLSARARRHITSRLTAEVSTQVFADIAPVHESTRDRGRLQDLERLGLTVCIGRRTELTFAFQLALAGDLGGSTFGGGIRVLSTL